MEWGYIEYPGIERVGDLEVLSFTQNLRFTQQKPEVYDLIMPKNLNN